MPPKIEEKEIKVVEVKERVRTRTRIIVRPDGTSDTTIDETRDTHSTDRSERVTKIVRDITLIGGYTLYQESREEPVFTVGLTKEVILGLGIGAYATSDSEVGLLLSYTF